MKKIELTHDIIAKEVFESASELHRMRRDIERRIKNRYADFQNSGIPLAHEELQLILPYMDIVRIHEDERGFVLKMESDFEKENVKRKKRRRNIIIGLASLSLVFILLSIFAFYQKRIAVNNGKESFAMSLALAAQGELINGKPSAAFRLADMALNNGTKIGSKSIAEGVIRKVGSYPFIKDIYQKDTITSILFYSKEKRFLTTSKDSTINIWDYSGTKRDSFKYSSSIIMAKLSPNDELLGILTKGDELLIRKLGTKETFSLKAERAINNFEFSRDSELCLTSSSDGKVLLWDLLKKSTLVLIDPKNKPSQARFLYFDSDSEPSIVTASGEMVAAVWKLNGTKFRPYDNSFGENPKGVIEDMDVSPSGDYIIFNSSTRDFMIKRGGSEVIINKSKFFSSQVLRNSKFTGNRDLNHVLSVSEDSNKVFLLNFSKDYIEYEFAPFAKILYSELTGNNELVFSSTSDHRAFVYKRVEKMEAYSVSTFSNLYQVNCNIMKGKFAPDNEFFVSTDGGRLLKIWRFRNPKKSKEKKQPLDIIRNRLDRDTRQLYQSEIEFYFN